MPLNFNRFFINRDEPNTALALKLPRVALRLALLMAPCLIALVVPATRFVLLQTPPLAPVYQHCRQFIQPNYEQPSLLSSAQAHPRSPAAQFYSLANESDEHWESSFTDDFYTPPGKPDIYADYESTMLQDKRAAPTVDLYIARFPRVPWLLAFRLQMLQSIGMQDGRVARPIEKPAPWDGRVFDQGGSLANHLHPPQEMILTYLPAMGLRVGASVRNEYFHTKLAYARRGQRLEPGNCFFDLWTARCLFALFRDREALAILHHAASQPFYDSHQRDRLQAQEEATRELGSAQLLSLLSASELVRPSWLELRHTIQLATALAVRLEAAGHHAQALQIYGDLMRLCVTMRQGPYFSEEGLASCAFIAIVWAGANRTVTVREVRAKNARIFAGDWLRIGAAKFAAYAAAHGRADPVRQARSEGERFASLREKLEPFIPRAVYWPTPRFGAFAWYRACTLLLPFLLLQWAALVVFRVGFFILLVPNGLKSEKPRRRDLTLLLIRLFFVVAFCAGVSMTLELERVFWSTWVHIEPRPGSTELAAYAAAAAFLTPFIATALFVAVAASRRQRQCAPDGPVLVSHAVAFWDACRRGEMPSLPCFRIAPVALAVICWTPIIVTAVGLEVVIAMYVLQYWANSLAVYSSYTYYNTQIAPLLIALIEFCLPVVLFGWILRWRWWPAPRHRQSAHYALACYREALSGWHIMLGWLILGVALLTVPSFAAVERQRADNIQRENSKP